MKQTHAAVLALATSAAFALPLHAQTLDDLKNDTRRPTTC